LGSGVIGDDDSIEEVSGEVIGVVVPVGDLSDSSPEWEEFEDTEDPLLG
jgi:hypothetical protein